MFIIYLYDSLAKNWFHFDLMLSLFFYVSDLPRQFLKCIVL